MDDQMVTFELYGSVEEINRIFSLLTTEADKNILKLNLDGEQFQIETDYHVLPIQRWYNHDNVH